MREGGEGGRKKERKGERRKKGRDKGSTERRKRRGRQEEEILQEVLRPGEGCLTDFQARKYLLVQSRKERDERLLGNSS